VKILDHCDYKMSLVDKTCYVIMPFSETKSHKEEYWTNHFDFFLKPFIEKKLKMKAQKSKALIGDIVNSILTDLTTADIVIADITDLNPNVLWELGVRHSFKKSGTVLIAEKETKIPFDIIQESTHFYFDHSVANPINKEFFIEMEKVIKKCITHPSTMDSPVFVAISGRGTFHEIITKDETIKKLSSLQSELRHVRIKINVALKTVKQNQQFRKNEQLNELSFTTGRLSVSAIECLFVNQYLDESHSFYEMCDKCFRETVRIDEQIITWHNHGKTTKGNTTEKWLIKFIPIHQRLITAFEKKIEIAKLRLLNIK
jgi:hypothetical protein